MKNEMFLIPMYLTMIVIMLYIMYDSWKNYLILKKRYWELLTKKCLDNCEKELFKGKDFFLLEENSNLVSKMEDWEELEYVDYIGNDCKLFV